MARQMEKLLHLAEHRVRLAMSQLQAAEAAVSQADTEAKEARQKWRHLEDTHETRRQNVLDGFIGAPAERLEFGEVMERLQGFKQEIVDAEAASEAAEARLLKARTAKAEAATRLKHVQRDQDRRDKALSPKLASQRKDKEMRNEASLEEDFLNGFGR